MCIRDRYNTFKIDTILANHGHSVLRLPDLNPIELIWANVKERVKRKNVHFSVDSVDVYKRQALYHATMPDPQPIYFPLHAHWVAFSNTGRIHILINTS